MFKWFGKKDSQPEVSSDSQREVSSGGSIIHRHTKLSAPKVGLSDKSMMEFAMAREDVYQRHFGEASQVFHEWIPLIPHIDVMEYYRDSKDGKICVLVTSGMSD